MEYSSSLTMEIIKLVFSTLTPLAVVWVGYVVTRATKRLESVEWANRTVIETRLQVFSLVAPKLNRLLCFALFIGTWKDISPTEAIKLKRATDEIMHVNRVLFSPQLFAAYSAFVDSLFRAYARTDGDALIRAEISCVLGTRRSLKWWEDSMEAYFDSLGPSSHSEIQEKYTELGEAFRRDLYVTREELAIPDL
jgi:hypothetical protein